MNDDEGKSLHPHLAVVTEKTDGMRMVTIQVPPLRSRGVRRTSQTSIIITRPDEIEIYETLSRVSRFRRASGILRMYFYLRGIMRNQEESERERYRTLLLDLARLTLQPEMAHIALWCAALL